MIVNEKVCISLILKCNTVQSHTLTKILFTPKVLKSVLVNKRVPQSKWELCSLQSSCRNRVIHNLTHITQSHHLWLFGLLLSLIKATKSVVARKQKPSSQNTASIQNPLLIALQCMYAQYYFFLPPPATVYQLYCDSILEPVGFPKQKAH